MEDLLPEHFAIVCYFLSERALPYAHASSQKYETQSFFDTPMAQSIHWPHGGNEIHKCQKHLLYLCQNCLVRIVLKNIFQSFRALAQVSRTMSTRVEWRPFAVTLSCYPSVLLSVPFPEFSPPNWLRSECDAKLRNRYYALYVLRMFGVKSNGELDVFARFSARPDDDRHSLHSDDMTHNNNIPDQSFARAILQDVSQKFPGSRVDDEEGFWAVRLTIPGRGMCLLRNDRTWMNTTAVGEPSKFHWYEEGVPSHDVMVGKIIDIVNGFPGASNVTPVAAGELTTTTMTTTIPKKKTTVGTVRKTEVKRLQAEAGVFKRYRH